MDRTFVKEMLGSMTHFELLTPALLAEAASEGLTYEELELSMSQLGLDIKKILIDHNKKYRQAYYVDFEKGFYSEILFQKSCLDSLLRIAAASLKEGNGNRHLEAQEWHAFYSCDVPVPMRIYDFQRRYLQIPEDEVFSVWRDIHTRIDYCNDMWDPDVLNYVLDRAPEPQLPELEEDGCITVYRGMGEMSLPPEKALSWSTNPINALWFANRSGRGTKLLVAHLKPDQIVAWFPSFLDENEVIVRPGSGIEYREENFIPSTLQYVPVQNILNTPDIFLRDSRCIIHEGKPRVCKLYPFVAGPADQGGLEYLLSTEKPFHFKGQRIRAKAWMKKYLTDEEREFIEADAASVVPIARLLQDIPQKEQTIALLHFIRFKYSDFDLDQPFVPQYKRNMAKLEAVLQQMITNGGLVAYARVARGLGYPTESVIQHHGLKHILRVRNGKNTSHLKHL